MSCKNGKTCKIVGMVLRYLLGAICVIFGLNKFFQFMEMPPLPEAAQSFMMALVETGYVMPTLGIVFLAVGVALLSGFFVPLALVILAPVSVNIFFFHAFLDPTGIGAAFLVTALNFVLLIKYKKAYCKLLKPKCCCNKEACSVK